MISIDQCSNTSNIKCSKIIFYNKINLKSLSLLALWKNTYFLYHKTSSLFRNWTMEKCQNTLPFSEHLVPKNKNFTTSCTLQKKSTKSSKKNGNPLSVFLTFYWTFKDPSFHKLDMICPWYSIKMRHSFDSHFDCP